MDVCVACGVFLFDWMCRPLPRTDYFADHVRRVYLQKAIPELLPEFHRLLAKVNSLLEYTFTTRLRSVIRMAKRRRGIYGPVCMNDPRRAGLEQELLELEWLTTVQLFREHVSREDIDFLLVMIEEKYILDSTITAELWLGSMLRTLMRELPQIHMEHTRKLLPTDLTAVNGLICPKEHAIAHELFEDDLYA